jgi:hypothetical protein
MKHVSPKSVDAVLGRLGPWPNRPDARVLNETIPLFFIARDTNGRWLVSDADTRTGGPFLFKQSAIDFVEDKNACSGYAVMFIDEPLKLDAPTKAGSFTGWAEDILCVVARRAFGFRPPTARALFGRGRP